MLCGKGRIRTQDLRDTRRSAMTTALRARSQPGLHSEDSDCPSERSRVHSEEPESAASSRVGAGGIWPGRRGKGREARWRSTRFI